MLARLAQRQRGDDADHTEKAGAQQPGKPVRLDALTLMDKGCPGDARRKVQYRKEQRPATHRIACPLHPRWRFIFPD
ncbi:MAG: hypothetical protein DYG89_24755 [Caldilinea sp. CFX5]|nr:hypothetical protein [Caldilinea sp. CFX5]